MEQNPKQSKNILHNTEADKHALQKSIFVILEWLFFLAKSFKISRISKCMRVKSLSSFRTM